MVVAGTWLWGLSFGWHTSPLRSRVRTPRFPPRQQVRSLHLLRPCRLRALPRRCFPHPRFCRFLLSSGLCRRLFRFGRVLRHHLFRRHGATFSFAASFAAASALSAAAAFSTTAAANATAAATAFFSAAALTTDCSTFAAFSAPSPRPSVDSVPPAPSPVPSLPLLPSPPLSSSPPPPAVLASAACFAR